MRKLSAQVLASVALFALAANNGLAAVQGSPADRCLAHLREVAESKSFYWAWTEPWVGYSPDGDRRCAKEVGGRIVPASYGETVLDLGGYARLQAVPRMFYLDLANVTGSWFPPRFYAANRATYTAIIRKVWKDNGSMCVFSWHMGHPCTTNGYSWGNITTQPFRYKCKTHPNVIRAILNDEQWPCGVGCIDGKVCRTPDASPRAWFMRQLGEVADFFDGLRDEKGDRIPVILRYAHEMDGGWFWWGKDWCSCDEFIALARMEADYLRRRCGNGQILFAYTPDRTWKEIGQPGVADGNYLAWYPGDEYVDIVGYDDYYIGKGDTEEKRRDIFEDVVSRLRKLTAFAQVHGKVMALSESGVDGSDTYYSTIYRLMTSEGVKAAFFNSWGGKWTLPSTPGGERDVREFVQRPEVIVVRNLENGKTENSETK